MRLLIVADSHGRGMGSQVKKENKNWDAIVVRVGRVAPEVYKAYEDLVPDIRKFRPEACVLHVGHNDLTYHSRFNPNPMDMMSFLKYVLGFIDRIQSDLPPCRIHYSSIFPRTVGYKMGKVAKETYNAMAVEYSREVTELFQRRRMPYIINDSLWFSMPEGREHPVFFQTDGLHLSALGREFVIREWMEKVAGRR